jgi:hypothetical protein
MRSVRIVRGRVKRRNKKSGNAVYLERSRPNRRKKGNNYSINSGGRSRSEAHGYRNFANKREGCVLFDLFGSLTVKSTGQ